MGFLRERLEQQTRRSFELLECSGSTHPPEVARIERGANQRPCFEGDQCGAGHRIMRVREAEVTEHRIFGTAQPLHGLSGAIRRYAYPFSEGRTAHWLLLMAGDPVDVVESRITALLHGRPDNVVTETGVLREFRGNAYRTRFGQHRADLKHQPLDAVLWVAPYAAIGCGLYLAAKQLSSARY